MKKYLWLSSAAVMIGALRVKNWNQNLNLVLVIESGVLKKNDVYSTV